MSQSIQFLEEGEQNLRHSIDLLNQAEQALEQFRISNQKFIDEHHLNQPTGHAMADAIADVKKVLNEAVERHNEISARLQEAKAEAAQHPYEPESI